VNADLPPIVLKIGGNEVDDETFLRGFVAAVVTLHRRAPLVIVHGGGKEIGDLHTRLGVAFETVEGLRVTPYDSLQLVKMVLGGVVNNRLTRWLVNAGLDAVGVSGIDAGLMRVEPLRPGGQDIGFVGRVVQVRVDVLRRWLAAGFLPVISPVSLGLDGHSYNVNADQAASAIACAAGAQRLIFVSNVPGVRIDGAVSPCLTVDEIARCVADGQIAGGMLPKVRAAVDAIHAGVGEAVITDLAGLRAGMGTAVVATSGFLPAQRDA
jgi:acetylglutamate kinase